jgi:predicted TIM-barrel fold metal-dependent hydrolase
MHEEDALEPERPIVDPHLHLWEILPMPGLAQAAQRFLFDECRATLDGCGHNITHTVYVETHMMHRADGPAELAPVGETEFANGIAAMSASGRYGSRRIAHRIVGAADLRVGDRLEAALDAHQAAAGERFRGVRMATAWSEAGMFGFAPDPAGRHIMRDPAYVAGARALARRGLSLDVWCLHSQLDEVIALADAVPDLTIVLDHCGTPEVAGRWAGRREEALREWQAAVRVLAERPNVVVKLGGLGMPIDRMLGERIEDTPSTELAEQWRPIIEPLIAIFGAGRAMFESNFPPDRDAGTYRATWNAFKRIAAGASEAEKDALFRGTASRIYRISG